jgi:hypothetical protein
MIQGVSSPCGLDGGLSLRMLNGTGLTPKDDAETGRSTRGGCGGSPEWWPTANGRWICEACVGLDRPAEARELGLGGWPRICGDGEGGEGGMRGLLLHSFIHSKHETSGSENEECWESLLKTTMQNILQSQ